MPSGQLPQLVCETAVICAMAVAMSDLGLEKDLDDRDAVERLRLNVIDIVDGGGDGALVNADNAVRDVFRRQAGVVPDNADDRNVDVWEDVFRSTDDD